MKRVCAHGHRFKSRSYRSHSSSRDTVEVCGISEIVSEECLRRASDADIERSSDSDCGRPINTIISKRYGPERPVGGSRGKGTFCVYF